MSDRRSRSGLRRALPAVAVLEPDDVVELGRRDLDDGRVLDRRHAVDGAGPVPEAGAGRDDLGLEDGVARLPQLELRAPALEVPALVLLPVELEAERVA